MSGYAVDASETDESSAASLALHGSSRDPRHSPFSLLFFFFFLRMHHLLMWPSIAVPSTAVSHLGRHPPNALTAVHRQSNQSEAVLSWQEESCDFQHGALLHSKFPSLHKRNNERLKKRRRRWWRGGQASLSQDSREFQSVVTRRRGGCRHKEEQLSLHLPKAAVGLPHLGLFSFLFWCFFFSPSSLISSPLWLCDFWGLFTGSCNKSCCALFSPLSGVGVASHQLSHHVWSDASERNPDSHHRQDHPGCPGDHLSLQLSRVCWRRVALPSRAQRHLPHPGPRASPWR